MDKANQNWKIELLSLVGNRLADGRREAKRNREAERNRRFSEIYDIFTCLADNIEDDSFTSPEQKVIQIKFLCQKFLEQLNELNH